jgi:TonB family protein
MTMPVGTAMQSMAEALGWTLLHFCWQGALAALLLWCALALLEGRSARARYAACCLALALIVTLPVITFAHLAGDALAAQRALAAPFVDLDPIVVNVGAAATAVPLNLRIEQLLDRCAPWVPVLWLAGVIVFLLRLNAGLGVARSLRSRGTAAAPAELYEVFDSLRQRLGIRRAVGLLRSSLVQVPTVVGWLKPVVLIPVGCLAGLAVTQIEALLAHELAHVRRHDYLVSVFQSAVEALLFYHPAVWWLSRQLRRERECCCDRLAVAIAGDALAYARALSFLEERRAGIPAIVLSANGGVLTVRIRRLLGYRDGSAVSQLAAIALLIAMAASAVVCVSSVARAELRAAVRLAPRSVAQRLNLPGGREVELIVPAALNAEIVTPEAAGVPAAALQLPVAAQDSSADIPTSLRGPYKTWITQDVLWIISPEERAAFLKLQNDEERDLFIQQFWERRNPIPGSAENSFRSEHYARIAYANEHFAANAPGWKSDRGHIYIAYGKPESIGSHPSAAPGSGSSFPYEIWHYRHIDGIGDKVDLKFVDTCNCGEYHYTIDPTGKDLLKNVPQAAAADQTQFAAKLLAPPAIGSAQHYDLDLPKLLCAPKVTGNVHIPTAAILSRMQTREGTVYDPAIVQSDFDILWRTGYFSNIKVFWADKPGGCRNLTFQLTEKPTIAPASFAKPVPQTDADSSQTGEAISGAVLDQTGAVLARTHVTLTNAATGAQRIAETDDLGRYSFSGLAAGAYTVEVNAIGFKRLAQSGIQVDGQHSVVMNLRLAVGSTSEVLNVVAPATVDSGVQGQVVGQEVPPVVRVSPLARGPIRVSGGVMAAQLISRPDPVYPPEAKEKGIAGAVVLHAIISKTGAIESLTVVSGPQVLQMSALDAVKQWTYKPYLLNGQPVEVDTVITVNYTFGGAAYPVAAQDAIPAPTGRPIRVSGGTIAGNLLSRPNPVYPAEARAKGIGGAVILHALISKAGMIENLTVISGPPELQASAIDAVKQWTYKPYLLNGEPVEVETTITVNYTFGGGPGGGSAGGAPGSAVTDTQMFETGVRDLQKGQTEVGKLVLQTLVERYPDSRYAARAKAMIADSQEFSSISEIKTEPKQLRSGVTPPEAIYSFEPEYTREARQAKVAGSVLVRLVVDEQGTPTHVQVARGLGLRPDGTMDPAVPKAIADGLNQRAVEAVSQYKFKPAMEDGKPVPVSLNIEVNFQIF